MRWAAVLALTVFAIFPGARAAETTAYDKPSLWLCRPGRADACAVNLDATIIAANGATTIEIFRADPDPPIDCFYVYPTVSKEPGGNSDRNAGKPERRAVAQQFARFGSRCRLFAPMYRQATLAAGSQAARDLAYTDVAAAWSSYLARDNRGRGVVLIGHSQGASLLARLIRERIDGEPAQDLLVSAILMGVSLPVKTGVEPEQPFPRIPVCRDNAQTACVIAFASFRADAPPTAGSRLVAAPPGMHSVCANPAALAGGAGALDAYLSASGATIFGEAAHPLVWTSRRAITTPFVKRPGWLGARCEQDDRGAYLAVTRASGVADLVVAGKVQPDWGLHLIDANLAIGNLLAIVGEQTHAFLARTRK